MRRGRRRNGEDGEPMATLEQFLDAARQVESLEVEIPAGEDPLEGLEALIDRARRETEGEGGEALRRLQERIESARQLPEPVAYRRQAGDPLEVLQARIRGEFDEDGEAAAPEDVGGGEPAKAPAADVAAGAKSATGGGLRSRREEMGAALEESLRRRPLSGELRAEVAARLAALMDGASGEEIGELWELVVFGDGVLGSNAKEG